MPGTPDPVGWNQGLPPFWNAVTGAIKGTQQAVNGLASGAPSGWITDSNGNVTELSGANLNQVVTIGAAFQQAGVLVSTGIANGTAGRAVQSGPAITTINLTKGSTSATVGTVTGASLAIGQVIGAALVTDPTTGTLTSAITPGTTISNVSGSTVTLSQGAAESGTGLYCAAARFIVQQDTGWTNLSLASGWSLTTGVYPPSVRLVNGTVWLSGAMLGNSSSPPQWTTIPAAFRPAETISLTVATTAAGSTFGTISIDTSGNATQNIGLTPTSSTVYLDGLNYRLF